MFSLQSSVSEQLPFILLAIGGYLAATASVFLPETAGKDLPNTIEEAEAFGKGQPFFYVPMLHEKKKTMPDDIIHK
jgi:hypothetical protein